MCFTSFEVTHLTGFFESPGGGVGVSTESAFFNDLWLNCCLERFGRNAVLFKLLKLLLIFLRIAAVIGFVARCAILASLFTVAMVDFFFLVSSSSVVNARINLSSFSSSCVAAAALSGDDGVEFGVSPRCCSENLFGFLYNRLRFSSSSLKVI